MALIFWLSAQPAVPVPLLFWGQDKLAHAIFFGVLGVFLARSLTPPQVLVWSRVLLVTVLVVAYGISDEYHQSFVPGRDASPWDVLADATGGFLAAWLLHRRDTPAVKPP